MLLYNAKTISNKKERPIQTISLDLSVMPEKPEYLLRGDRDRAKYNKQVRSLVYKSMEYKKYIKFLKKYMDMSRCAILEGLDTSYGKKYTIEIHHCPFTLLSIIDTVVRKREQTGEPLDPLDVADEVTELHLDGKVGLVPLSATMHELAENGRIFIPLNFIYHDYGAFFEEYEPYMDAKLLDNIDRQVKLTLKCQNIQSDVLIPEFTYVNIEGVEFPTVPTEWIDLFKVSIDAE